LRRRDPTEVDLERVSVWCDQLQLDAQRHDLAGIGSDAFTLYCLRRPHRTIPQRRTASDDNHELGVLHEAAIDRDLPLVRGSRLTR
jgi:hypothetical protein